MKMNEVWVKAKALGIKAKNPKKADLIRMVQRAEGNFDCFGRAEDHCDRMDCCFRSDCITDDK